MNMTCEIVRDFAELYYERLVQPETAKAIRIHLGGCRNCRNYYQECKALRKQKAKPSVKIFSDSDLHETEQRLYLNLSEKLRKRRFWEIVGTSAALGAGSVMLTIGLFLTHKENHTNS